MTLEVQQGLAVDAAHLSALKILKRCLASLEPFDAVEVGAVMDVYGLFPHRQVCDFVLIHLAWVWVIPFRRSHPAVGRIAIRIYGVVA